MLRAATRSLWSLLAVAAASCSAPPPRTAAAGAADAGRTDSGRDAAAAVVPPAPEDAGVGQGTEEGLVAAAVVPVGPEASVVPATDAGSAPSLPPVDAGATARDVPAAPRTVVDGSAVVRRIGCDAITRAQVDAQLRLLAAWQGRAIDPAEIPDDDPLRAEALETLVDQRIVEREARARGLRAESWEVQQAAGMLAQRMGGEPVQMYGMFQQLGVGMAEVEASLEAQVLAYKVAAAISDERGVRATDEQIAAEYAARTAGLDPSVVRPLEQARDGLRREIEFRLRLEAGRAWVVEQREALAGIRTTTRGGRCVELPAEERPGS